MSVLTAERAREVFHYDPVTGVLYWRIRPSNNVKAGDPVGSLRMDGYFATRFKGESYYIHRLVWFVLYKRWPAEIDHIDHDRLNNRAENLREVSHPVNGKNQSLPSNNTGLGVCGLHRQADKWRARIRVDGHLKSLGMFDDWFDAVCARKAAEAEHGFHANHGR